MLDSDFVIGRNLQSPQNRVPLIQDRISQTVKSECPGTDSGEDEQHRVTMADVLASCEKNELKVS